MKQLANKHILLCVTGGIAAYKAAEIIRLFKTSGSNIRVLMTEAAQEFITPLTMQALSGNQVHTDLLDTKAEAAMGHIELAKWSDIILIAPCSANSIARLASGKGDDLMTAVIKSSPFPEANLAIELAEQGAIRIMSLHLASSICPIAASAFVSNRSV